MTMQTYDELVAARRQWNEDVLIPWCKVAERKELLLAETEWTDLAGRPDPEMTLWKWAWERFPALVHDGLNSMNETNCLEIHLHDGRLAIGYPDSKKSQAGMMFVTTEDGKTMGPIMIDEIKSITIAT